MITQTLNEKKKNEKSKNAKNDSNKKINNNALPPKMADYKVQNE